MSRRHMKWESVIILLTWGMVWAQSSQRVVRALVRDQNTRQPIESVEVSLPGTTLGTVTDMAGRFTLKIPKGQGDVEIRIQHIAYEPRTFRLSQLEQMAVIELVPRVIPLQGVKVEAEGTQTKIKNDLPQAIRVLEARDFQNKGYVDAADMLKTDHSVQVSESYSGRRQVSLRGGNPDETVILYNNIRLNRLYDNRFDLSLIDIDEMSRLEVVKGSNTILYGTGALAGVINIIPQFKKDYSLGFKQGVGSYDAGNWSLQAYRAVGPMDISYTFKKGATHRRYEGSEASQDMLENEATHHQANVAIRLGSSGDNQIRLSGLSTDFDYTNERLDESLWMKSQIVMAQFTGRLPLFGSLESTSAYSTQEEKQDYSSRASVPHREMDSQSIQWNIEKPLVWNRFETVLAYQFEYDEMAYQEMQSWNTTGGVVVPYDLTRNHHGTAVVGKYHAPSGFEMVSTMDFDLSLRRDWVSDHRIDDKDIVGSKWEPSWPAKQSRAITTVKFSAHISGVKEDLVFSTYMNYGTSVKFPSLIQEVSQPMLATTSQEETYLEPEESRSTELGVELTRQIKKNDLVGWQITGNFFQNYYNNKFRYYFVPGIPVAYYDNVRMANIKGLEASGRVFLFQKKVTLGGGVSKYFVSDKAAFPFKYDRKFVADCLLEHQGWQAHLQFFAEGPQVGWIRFSEGSFAEVDLPGFCNFDFFIGKKVTFLSFKGQFNASVRNLLDTEILVAELPYRERQFNLSFGIRY